MCEKLVPSHLVWLIKAGVHALNRISKSNYAAHIHARQVCVISWMIFNILNATHFWHFIERIWLKIFHTLFFCLVFIRDRYQRKHVQFNSLILFVYYFFSFDMLNA